MINDLIFLVTMCALDRIDPMVRVKQKKETPKICHRDNKRRLLSTNLSNNLETRAFSDISLSTFGRCSGAEQEQINESDRMMRILEHFLSKSRMFDFFSHDVLA